MKYGRQARNSAREGGRQQAAYPRAHPLLRLAGQSGGALGLEGG